MSFSVIFPDASEFRLVVLGFNCAFMITCVTNVVAALKIWRLLTIPYILLDFIRLCIILACHIILMMIYKKQLNLGVLIAACSIGGFFILFLGYMWSCSVALFQIVGIVNSKEYQKIASLSSPAPGKFQRNITISSITLGTRPLIESKNDKNGGGGGMFASDFSEFNRKQKNFRI